MKRSLMILVLILIPFAATFAGGEQETGASAGKWADGVYFAAEEGFSPNSGWRYVVTLEVKGGKIAMVDWNGANVKGGIDKKSLSKDGGYNMVAYGGAQSEWHVQAELTEKHLLASQDPKAITYTNDAGNTDDIAGVSIHVKEFYNLVNEALAAGPAGFGPYKDGAFHAEEAEFAGSGWKNTADFTVISGRIVAAYWNGVHKDGGDDKKTVSMAGDYPMVANGGAQSDWHVQAELTEKSLLANQDPMAVTFTEGKTDAITGVSISAGAFYALAAEALEKR